MDFGKTNSRYPLEVLIPPKCYILYATTALVLFWKLEKSFHFSLKTKNIYETKIYPIFTNLLSQKPGIFKKRSLSVNVTNYYSICKSFSTVTYKLRKIQQIYTLEVINYILFVFKFEISIQQLVLESWNFGFITHSRSSF